MAELKKHALALYLIGVLILLKFIFVPVIDWQDSVIAEHQLKQRKLSKANTLLNNKATLQEQAANLEEKLLNVAPYFYTWQEESVFKREQQQIIETELAKFDLRSKRIGWKESFPTDGQKVIKYNIEYSFEGSGYQVINYLVALKMHSYLTDTPQTNLSFRGQGAGKLGIISVFLSRNYYMQLKGSDLDDK